MVKEGLRGPAAGLVSIPRDLGEGILGYDCPHTPRHSFPVSQQRLHCDCNNVHVSFHKRKQCLIVTGSTGFKSHLLFSCVTLDKLANLSET